MGNKQRQHGSSRMLGTTPGAEAPGVVAAKLSPPRLHREHVPRRRLVERLDAGSDRALLLLRAPAGSGKSTLLSEWLSQAPWASGWVSLDERDNELGAFLSYVVAAVRSAFPTVPSATQDLLHALALPPLETLASSLADDFARLPAEFILVLDDYHAITNPHIHQLLESVLRHPPARLHLAIATRAEPPWPLARPRARGEVTELRYEELLFTSEESAAFLRQALGETIDHDLAIVLHEESEGWAAGLQLMALALKGRTPEALRASRAAAIGDDIETVLLDEVFAFQPPSVQSRLLQISVLNRFSASLCETVCAQAGIADAQAGWGKTFLSGLDRANLFLIPLDAGHEFFRFHHLFQQFLAARLREQCDADEIAALHLRASRWFEERGLIEEALDHALAAGHVGEAADIVARHRHELYNQEQFARLTRWLRLLPPEAKEHHAEVLLAEARIATMNWRFLEATVFLDHAERELAATSLTPPAAALASAELVALRSILDFWDGDAERVEQASQHLLTVLPPDASHLRGLAHTGMATSAYLHGDISSGLAYLDEQLANTAPQDPAYAWLLQTQGFLYWLHGDWANLRLSASRLLWVSEERALPEQQALAHYLLGAAHYACNDLPAAEARLIKAVAARFVMRLMWWAQAAGLLSLTVQALGRPREARQIAEDAQAFLLERHAMRLLPGIGAYQAELDRLQGRVAAAAAWAKHADPGPLTWALAAVEPKVAQTRAFLAEDEASARDQTAILIAELRAFCARLPNRRLGLEVEALAAIFEIRRGETGTALAAVRRLVLDAEPDGWLRLFVDAGEEMEQLLRRLVDNGEMPLAVTRILAAFPARLAVADGPDQRSLLEPLSQRELEVLTLLRARDSNKEIAARLFIAPGTVKRHTISIYRKLDVNDRRRAIARATELGLLPPA